MRPLHLLFQSINYFKFIKFLIHQGRYLLLCQTRSLNNLIHRYTHGKKILGNFEFSFSSAFSSTLLSSFSSSLFYFHALLLLLPFLGGIQVTHHLDVLVIQLSLLRSELSEVTYLSQHTEDWIFVHKRHFLQLFHILNYIYPTEVSHIRKLKELRKLRS